MSIGPRTIPNHPKVATDAALGVPAIVAQSWYTGLIAGIATFTIWTAKLRGHYRVSMNAANHAAAGVGTVAVTVGWTDGIGATTASPITGLSVTSATSRSNPSPICFESVPGAAITLAVTFTGLVGTPSLDVSVTLERIR